jgi:hypothetical protein
LAKLWFKRKSYGWGWVPYSIEGWLITIGFVIAILYISIKYAETNPALFIAYLISLIAVLIFISYKKGEKPRWRWGNK